MFSKTVLVGYLGLDPEIRVLADGTHKAILSVATSEKWKKNDELQERTEWHRVIVWSRMAEIARDYLTKGSLVLIEGQIRYSKYQDKETGEDKYSTEIVADELKLLDRKPKDTEA